jgi:hypothetical protein
VLLCVRHYPCCQAAAGAATGCLPPGTKSVMSLPMAMAGAWAPLLHLKGSQYEPHCCARRLLLFPSDPCFLLLLLPFPPLICIKTTAGGWCTSRCP